MSLLDEQEQAVPCGSAVSETVVTLPVTVEESAGDVRVRDAYVDITPGETPKYRFTISNGASLGLTTYEVRWTLFNAKGDSVAFSSTSESALPVAIVDPGALCTPPGGGSCMYFKGFQMSRAVAQLTYYELSDGTVYDSQKTKFPANRKARRVEWAEFYTRIKAGMTNKTSPAAEQFVRGEIAVGLARKTRTNSTMAAEAIQASLDGNGLEKTTALIQNAIDTIPK